MINFEFIRGGRMYTVDHKTLMDIIDRALKEKKEYRASNIRGAIGVLHDADFDVFPIIEMVQESLGINPKELKLELKEIKK